MLKDQLMKILRDTMIEVAIDLDAGLPTTHPEYLRGMVELIADTTGPLNDAERSDMEHAKDSIHSRITGR